MTQLQSIKAEIERRKKALHSTLFNDEYNDLLSFIESLEKEQSFTHHEIDESLRDAVTHQMEDDGDVDDFVRKGIDDIVLKYAELGARWQKWQKPAEELFDNEKMIKGLIDGITNLASQSNYGDSITFGGFNWKDCVVYLKKLNSENVKKYTFTDVQESYKRGHLKGEEVGMERMMIEIQREHDGEEWINPDDFTAHIRQAYQDGFREGVKSIKLVEWSEEDEYVINKVLNWAEIVNPTSTIFEKLPKEQFIERLKSLRPQPHTVSIRNANKFAELEYERGVKDGIQSEKSRHWKPSEEQMKALSWAINYLTDIEQGCASTLALLKFDLKELI